MEENINRAGDLLVSILGDKINIAREHVKMYRSWQDIVLQGFLGKKSSDADRYFETEYSSEYEKLKIINAEKAANHSRVLNLENGILFVETDHSGWIQILQTREKQILKLLRHNFPELNIRNIAFKLIKQERDIPETIQGFSPDRIKMENGNAVENDAGTDMEKRYEKIKNYHFRQILKRLEKSVKERDDATSVAATDVATTNP
jgi:hypothetical protein